MNQTLAEAREYLAKVLPWPQDGEDAYCNIHYTVHDKKYPKPIWRGTPCRTVDEAVKAIQYAQTKADTRDIYACMSSQSKCEEKVNPHTGKTFRVGIRSQENAVGLKSLFLDIDVRPGEPHKGYESMGDATAALGVFLQATGLPKPSIIVASGGGLQPYWVLAKQLTIEEWRPLAFALAEATKREGLRCDSGCTIDSARVLRVPDTKNCKQEPLRPVRLAGARTDFDYSVDRIWRALEPYRVSTPTQNNKPSILAGFPQRQPITEPSELAAGVDTRGSLVDLGLVVPECGFVREALATGGMTNANPLWNLTTLLATFCDNGRAQAHAMGNQHPGYTKESTDELYDRKERERAEKNLGWPSCATISASGCVACASCKHLAAGKSPLAHRSQTASISAGSPPANTGIVVTTGQGAGNIGAAVNDLPPGYSRDASGIVFRAETDDAGVTVQKQLCKYPMFDPWMQENPDILHFNTTIGGLRHRQITLPLEVIPSNDALRKALWAQGITYNSAEAKTMEPFMTSWIQTLQGSKGFVVNSAPFGWVETKGKLEGFCYGDQVWMPSGTRQAASPDLVLAKQYRPYGELQPWRDAAELVTLQGRPELDAIIASAFAAPLVRFAGMPGLLMSVYSMESGIGKSTALKIAQSVWGNPITAMQGLSDTQNSVINKMGEIKSLPLYWDELKTEDDTRRFVNLAFQLSLGKEKSRLRADVSQRDPGTWQTIMVSASNESLLDFVLSRTKMTTAGLYRVFEYAVPKPEHGSVGQVGLARAQSVMAKLNSNFGNVGLEYAKFLGANFERVEAEVEEHFDGINKECDAMSDERYWLALVSCICMGARYANELGFATFDEPKLKGFMLGVLEGMRSERKAQPVDMSKAINVSNILAQFFSAKRNRNTLFTKRIHIGVGRPPKTEPLRSYEKLEAVHIHRGRDDNLVHISSVEFSNWCRDAGYNPHSVTKALEAQFNMVRTSMCMLGSGTVFTTGIKEILLRIDLTGVNAAKYLDGDDVWQ